MKYRWVALLVVVSVALGACKKDVDATDGGAAPDAGGSSGAGGTQATADAGQGDAATAAGDAAADGGMMPDLGDFDGKPYLSQTGLYSDIAALTLAPGVESYEPQGVLWADGADKARYILLPAGQKIDTRDMDHWKYPVGTKVWKDFSVGGKRLETRLIEKKEDSSWRMIAYVWNDDGSDAVASPFGVQNAAGTEHDVPTANDCKTCHEGMADRVLGFTAIQLSGAAKGLTLAKLIKKKLLSAPPAAPFVLPGTADQQAALRYLHANCGHCHNPDSNNASFNISVYFWQRTDALATVKDTVTYKSLVTDKTLPTWIDAVKRRTQNRGTLGLQMPPLATEHVDDEGLKPVYAWMDQLAKQFTVKPILGGGPCTTGLDEVYTLFSDRGCATSFCHLAGQGMLMFNSKQELHDSLVNVDAKGETCVGVGLKRVEPRDPERSLLWIKLHGGPPCGRVMPPPPAMLSEADLKIVSDWIMQCDAP